MILKIFSSSSSNNQHPLSDPKELKRVLAELPVKDELKLIDEVAGWLESLCNAETIRPDQLWAATRQLDEAAQAALRRVNRDYLLSPRVSRAEETRYWTVFISYWEHCAVLYDVLCKRAQINDKASDVLKPHLALFFSRQLAALAALGKWRHFHYERLSDTFWIRLGAAYLAAEKLGVANKSLQLYPSEQGTSSAAQEYTQFIAFESSSLDSLLPLEIELAEKLIGHFAPLFVLNSTNRPDNFYWIDAAQGRPPLRLVKPIVPSSTIRLLSFGRAPEALSALIRLVEQGNMPNELSLGGQYSARAVLSVLQHLALYWAAQPPVRQSQRHIVKGRLYVLHGFVHCLAVQEEAASASLGEQSEVWIVENVSLGGFCAILPSARREAMRIGELLALQPEGGTNWLISIVRRYTRKEEVQSVGIESLSKHSSLVRLQLYVDNRLVAERVETAILLDFTLMDADVRLILAATSFDLRESYHVHLAGKNARLYPVELIEAGRDYEIARYRLNYLD